MNAIRRTLIVPIVLTLSILGGIFASGSASAQPVILGPHSEARVVAF
jgi:hypothetical protein